MTRKYRFQRLLEMMCYSAEKSYLVRLGCLGPEFSEHVCKRYWSNHTITIIKNIAMRY